MSAKPSRVVPRSLPQPRPRPLRSNRNMTSRHARMRTAQSNIVITRFATLLLVGCMAAVSTGQVSQEGAKPLSLRSIDSDLGSPSPVETGPETQPTHQGLLQCANDSLNAQ